MTTPAGVDMLDFFVDPGSGETWIAMADSQGHFVCAADSDGAGTGLFWPWIPVPFAAVDNTSNWPSNSTGSFVTIAQAGTNVFSQKLFVDVRTRCDGGATAGQVALFCNGNQVGSTGSVTTSVGDTVFKGVVTDQIGVFAFLEIKTRVTAGTGNCRAQVYQANWLQFAG